MLQVLKGVRETIAINVYAQDASRTHRRIRNWMQMTQWEKDRTLERIAKRNQARIAELQGEGSGEEGGGRAEL